MSTSVLQRLRARDNQLFLFATVLIGVLAGLSAVLFTLSIERMSHWLFGMSPSAARLLLVPSVVGCSLVSCLPSFSQMYAEAASRRRMRLITSPMAIFRSGLQSANSSRESFV